ncbi:MAG: class I SAM-dependent methyltransferase [Gammaproteobacteria bacterium]|nr:class I SAM-dependent methyltransferase [Gammaproteobacteria bacterium]
MNNDKRRYAPACDRNREPILEVLRNALPASGSVLEVGSGTGQHAVWFAPVFPGLQWQPSDRVDNLDSIDAWREHENSANVLPAMELDLSRYAWPEQRYDAVVCINTIHIVSWELVQALIAGAGRSLRPGGVFYVYGPYRYRDRPLEPSNENFDQWLKDRDPLSGIREFETINDLAGIAGLEFVEDRSMPANNQSIWWRRR